MATLPGAVEPAASESAALLEKVIVGGDLSRLTPAERLAYYQRVCSTVGLNPYTQPFSYLNLKGRGLVLYAQKGAADQLRKLHGISVDKVELTYADDLVIVTVVARTKDGRSDSDVGVVPLGRLSGEERANAIMKAVTKAKRRLTLSICGLGMLDETEVDSLPGAQKMGLPVDVDGGEQVVLGEAERVVDAGTGEVLAASAPERQCGNGHGPRDHDAKPAAPVPERPPEPALVQSPERAAEPGSSSAADWSREQLAAQIRQLAGVTLSDLSHWQELARTYGPAVPVKWKDMTQPWLLELYQALVARGWEERITLASSEEEVTEARSHALSDRDKRRITAEQYTHLYDSAERRYAELSGPLTAQAG